MSRSSSVTVNIGTPKPKGGRIGYHLGWTGQKISEFVPKEKKSLCVANITYDLATHIMTIVFMARGTFQYHDVEPSTFVEFNGAGSRGTYFNLYIRDRYPYERIA